MLLESELRVQDDSQILHVSDPFDRSIINTVVEGYWEVSPTERDRLAFSRVEDHAVHIAPTSKPVKIALQCFGVVRVVNSSKKLEVIRVNEARSSDGVINVVKVKQEYHRTEVASLRDTRCGVDDIGKCVSDSHPQRTSR